MSDYTLCLILSTSGKISRKTGLMIAKNSQLYYGTVGGGNVEYQALMQTEGGEYSFKACSGGTAIIGIYQSLTDAVVEQITTLKEPFLVKIEDFVVSVVKYGENKKLDLEFEKGRQGLFKEGEVIYYVERPYKELVLIGGGHVAKATYDLASYLEYRVTVIEKREEFLTTKLYPNAKRIKVDSYDEVPFKIKESAVTSVAVLTRDISQATLDTLAKLKLCYFGVMGHSELSPWYSPIGLNLGGERVKEVALSLMSEIQSVFYKTKPGNLKYAKGRLVLVRGAGDLATGVIVALVKAGYRVLATEIEKPTVIRRTVSFASVIYSNTMTLEGVTAQKAKNYQDAITLLEKGSVPILIDPELEILTKLKVEVVVDAILAKKNLGTSLALAPFVVALGPGFTAQIDCNVVVETKRGHEMGRLLYTGSAIANTGIPGIIAGFGKERVMHSPIAGVFKGIKQIGDIVKNGEIIAYVDEEPVYSTLDGRLRGLLMDGLSVPKGFKIADVDPRGEEAQYLSISDKARSLGGAVVIAVDNHFSTLVMR